MKITITPAKLEGIIEAPASKSFSHRYIIAASLADRPSVLEPVDICEDIQATISAVETLGAEVVLDKRKLRISPCKMENLKKWSREQKRLNFHINESGSTYRFFVAICAVLGLNSFFYLSGSLKSRPMTPLFKLLKSKGLSVVNSEEFVHISGKLESGHYEIDSDLSSQFVSGLLLGAASSNESWSILPVHHCEHLPSASYIKMTLKVLEEFGVKVNSTNSGYLKASGSVYRSSKDIYRIEGDWSNCAFFLAAAAIKKFNIRISGLNPCSLQGDRKILDIINKSISENRKNDEEDHSETVKIAPLNMNISDIPDLIPVLAVLAIFAEKKSRFFHIERLKYKESNRIETVSEILSCIGVNSYTEKDSLVISPAIDSNSLSFKENNLSSFQDHRIVMMISLLACIIDSKISITDADCVNKSYPRFWDDLMALGCKIEKGE